MLTFIFVISLIFTNDDPILVSIDGGREIIVIPAHSTFEVESVEYLVDDKIFILREPVIFEDGFEYGEQ